MVVAARSQATDQEPDRGKASLALGFVRGLVSEPGRSSSSTEGYRELFSGVALKSTPKRWQTKKIAIPAETAIAQFDSKIGSSIMADFDRCPQMQSDRRGQTSDRNQQNSKLVIP